MGLTVYVHRTVADLGFIIIIILFTNTISRHMVVCRAAQETGA